jgi:hypothetical protein
MWCRWLSSDKVSYLDPESINGINLYMYCGNNPVMFFDQTGHSMILALLIAAGTGLLAGLAGQFTADAITSMINRQWTFSSWQQYVGAGIGGALGGILLASGCGGVAIGAISASLSAFTGNGLEIVTGMKNSDYTSINLMFDTFASGLIGAFAGAIINIPGINRGSHSFQQIFKSGITKISEHGFSMSVKVFAKGFALIYVANYASTLYSIFQRVVEELDWNI